MFFISLFRVIRFAIQNFLRNFWLSLVTVTIIILALFSFTLLMGVNAVADAAVSSVEQQVDLTLYFEPALVEDDLIVLGKSITDWPEVASVDYVSPAEALENFTAVHANDPLILESLAELENNPLGGSLVIQAVDLAEYNNIVIRVDALGIDEFLQKKDFQNHEVIISKLRSVRDKVNQIGIVISSVFVAIAVLVVFNTIRMGIFTRREEIGIMRLVGASNWYIRMPFVFEGVLYTTLGVIVFWSVFFLILRGVAPHSDILFSDFGFDVVSYFQMNFWQLLLWQFGGMLLLNLFSISLALGRYLRV